MGEVSNKLAGGKVLVIVDALDEVDSLGLAAGANVLLLPITLPPGIYIVTMTRKVPLSLRVECEQRTLDIEQGSARNMADVHAYVEQAVARPGIRTYIAAQGSDDAHFVELLVAKSQGNFMCLRYVLPEIEAGAYKDLDLEALPAGLENYYEDHWRSMRGQDEEAWFRYKLPVAMALTAVKEPVSIELIADFSGVQDRPRIRSVLRTGCSFYRRSRYPTRAGCGGATGFTRLASMTSLPRRPMVKCEEALFEDLDA